MVLQLELMSWLGSLRTTLDFRLSRFHTSALLVDQADLSAMYLC
jgi:hypothetical protein